ncbi:hypothetical protein [Niastella populi]|uniref:hypothetical protein n=1 Tax=Niastella populi TaxID=550983 RepID=UPI0013FD9115|nr:hypothetical protein [Niastella populi]
MNILFCSFLWRYNRNDSASFLKDEVLMIDFAGDPLHYTNKESGHKVACNGS